MEIPEPEPGHWNSTSVVAKKSNILKRDISRFISIPNKVACESADQKSKPPRCFIKITGSRYSGSFLVSVDPTVDNAIYKSMKDIEVDMGQQCKRKPLSASPKHCLSSVFKCFNQSTDFSQQDLKNKYSMEHQKKNSSFLVSVDPTVDNEIYKSMKDIEADMGQQCKRKPLSATPKHCLSSVFKYFNQSTNFSLQDLKNKYSLERQRKLKDRTIKNKPKSESRPDVLASHPKDLKPPERNEDVDEIYKPTLSSLNKTEETEIISAHQAPILNNAKLSQTPTVDISNVQPQKKVCIRSSEDEIPMFQPPKTLKCNERLEDEIRLDLKAKASAVDVSRSIKLAKGKIEIGLQDSDIQLDKSIQKRSLHMIVEGDDNGKSSWWLTVHKLNSNEIDKKEKQESNKSAFPLLAKQKGGDHLDCEKNNNGTINASIDKESYKKELEQKNHMAPEAESPVGCNCPCEQEDNFELNPNSKSELKARHHHCSIQDNSCGCPSRKPLNNYCNSISTSSCQKYINDSQRENEVHESGSIFKCARVPELGVKLTRTPYLVHKLYEPRTSSIFVPAENMQYSRVKEINGAFYRLIDHHQISAATNDRMLMKKRYDSSSCLQDPKLNKQFNGADLHGYPPRKDFGVSNSAVEDFERMLQSICGPNYGYHKSEISNMEKEESCKGRTLRFDQWSQTENLLENIMVNGSSQINLLNFLRENMNVSHENSHSILNTPHRMNRTVNRYTQSDISYKNSSGNLMHETSVEPRNRQPALDSTKNGLLSKYKSSQNNEKFQDKRTLCCCTENVCADSTTRNQLVNEEELKEGIVNRKDASHLDEEVYLERSGIAVGESESVEKSGGNLINNSICHKRHFFNMALCSNLVRDELGRKNDRVVVEKKCKCVPEVVPYNRRFRPIKTKSRSCQNIFLSRTLNPIPRRTKKQRYPHMTVVESSGEQAEGLDYGLTNDKQRWSSEKGMENAELKDYNIFRPGKESFCRFHNFPPETGCLFLPQPILPGDTVDYRSEICGNPSGHTISLNRLSPITTVNPLSEQWCTPNSSQPVNSYERVNLKPCSMFHRTITTIKRAFRKKIGNLFRKKSITETLTRRLNRFKLNNHDKIIFIPVPLEKKTENIHLFKNRNSKYFPF